jgi:hypothetical protein
MCNIPLYMGVSAAVIALVQGVLGWSEFDHFCKRVAEQEDRTSEWKSKIDLNDAGTNKYLREQWWRIFSGRYTEYSNDELRSVAKSIRGKMFLQAFAGFVAILLLAVYDGCRTN